MNDTPSDRLRAARLNKGYKSSAEAARAYGWPLVTYKAHENGTRSFHKEASKYAKVFGVSAGWLMFGENPPKWLNLKNRQDHLIDFLEKHTLDIVYIPVIDNQELLQLVLNTLTMEQLMDKPNKIAIAPKDDFSKDLVAIEVIDESNFPEIKLKDIITIDLNRKPTHGKLIVAVIEGYENYVIGTLQREVREGKPTDILHFSNNSFPKIYLDEVKIISILGVVFRGNYE